MNVLLFAMAFLAILITNFTVCCVYYKLNRRIELLGPVVVRMQRLMNDKESK